MNLSECHHPRGRKEDMRANIVLESLGSIHKQNIL